MASPIFLIAALGVAALVIARKEKSKGGGSTPGTGLPGSEGLISAAELAQLDKEGGFFVYKPEARAFIVVNGLSQMSVQPTNDARTFVLAADGGGDPNRNAGNVARAIHDQGRLDIWVTPTFFVSDPKIAMRPRLLVATDRGQSPPNALLALLVPGDDSWPTDAPPPPAFAPPPPPGA